MFTRRQSLTAAAALPLATALPARAEAPMLGPAASDIRRFTLGDFEVTTLLSASVRRDDVRGIFGTNVDDDIFNAVSARNVLDPGAGTFFFTPTIVNTGAELVLFDTGLSPEAITGALARAGYTPEQVDTVVLTHMHGDHIGGMATDGTPTFPNAGYVTASAEYDFWAGAENGGFEANVRPFAERFRFIEDGEDVVTGLTAMAAHGHTPGHTVYHIESNGQRVLLFADLANHPVWSLANPDWHVRFDNDAEAAAISRRRVLDMIAADRIPAIGYHMPFPAIGYVAAEGDGFRWFPESGQLRG